MDAPIVIIDTMPNTTVAEQLNIVRISPEYFRDMVENADEILIAIHNKEGFNGILNTIMPEYDFDSCDGYHRDVESYCEWVWVDESIIYYITVA